jgi:alpha/beta superfamily hydrolase
MSVMVHHIPGPAGRMEALLDEPTACSSTGVAADEGAARTVSPLRPRAAVVVAHPHPLYGGTMHNKVVFRAAKAFCRLGCAVLRFNFRGVGTSEGRFDDGPGELADYRRTLDFMAARYPGAPLWTAGVSFGGWVALTSGATDDRVSVLVGIALPADNYDFAAVKASGKPTLLIHGERDEICPLRSVRVLYQQIPEPKELVVIDGADHLFDGHVLEVGDAIGDLLEDYGRDEGSGIRGNHAAAERQ